MLKTEFELFLKETAPGSIKNGYAIKTVKTTHGTIEVKIPRDESCKPKCNTLIDIEKSTYSCYTLIAKQKKGYDDGT